MVAWRVKGDRGVLVDGRKMISVRYYKQFDVEEDISALVRENNRSWWFIS